MVSIGTPFIDREDVNQRVIVSGHHESASQFLSAVYEAVTRAAVIHLVSRIPNWHQRVIVVATSSTSSCRRLAPFYDTSNWRATALSEPLYLCTALICAAVEF